jgi:hypothetical protein
MEVFYDPYRSSRNDTVVKIKEVKMGWEYILNGEIQMHKPDRRPERNDSKMPPNEAGVKMTEILILR